jgi:hypothetical protein
MVPLKSPKEEPAAPDAPAPGNRRAAVRHPCRLRNSGAVAGTRDLVARSAPIANLSVSGLALSLRRPLRRGSRLLIHLTSADRAVTFDLSARVTHATRQPDGKWLIGCTFSHELTPSELEQLL